MAVYPLTPEEIEALQNQLEALYLEHRDLDEVIQRLSEEPGMDQLQLRRLKKRKLQLKDKITRLEDRLIPDMDA